MIANIIVFLFFMVGMMIEVKFIYMPGEVLRLRKKVLANREEDKGDKELAVFGCFNITYGFLTILVMITTEQWPLALIVMLIGLLMSGLRYYVESKVIVVLDGVISFLLILFILLNHFTLHIPIDTYVRSWFV